MAGRWATGRPCRAPRKTTFLLVIPAKAGMQCRCSSRVLQALPRARIGQADIGDALASHLAAHAKGNGAILDGVRELADAAHEFDPQVRNRVGM